MIEYLNNLMSDFIFTYPEFENIKRSVGITSVLSKRNNLADLPLLLIDNISYSSTDSLNNNIGELTYDLAYINLDTKRNGYKELEDSFIGKFNTFICENKNEISINDIEFSMDDNDIYGVTYTLTSIYELK